MTNEDLFHTVYYCFNGHVIKRNLSRDYKDNHVEFYSCCFRYGILYELYSLAEKTRKTTSSSFNEKEKISKKKYLYKSNYVYIIKVCFRDLHLEMNKQLKYSSKKMISYC